jgi:hypothetical protein
MFKKLVSELKYFGSVSSKSLISNFSNIFKYFHCEQENISKIPQIKYL